jgi:hypothetical protein
MAKYTPCPGVGVKPVDIQFYPSQPDGLGYTRAKTFGKCAECGYTVMEYGNARNILKVPRHKKR